MVWSCKTCKRWYCGFCHVWPDAHILTKSGKKWNKNSKMKIKLWNSLYLRCDVFCNNHWIFQVFDEGLTFDDEFMEIAAPKPLPLPKFFSMIYPLDDYVWISAGFAYILAGIIFWIFSNVEGKLTNTYFQ